MMVSTAAVAPDRDSDISGNGETRPVPDGLTEDGITPTAGERWRIYGHLLDGGSIATSACAGSHRQGEPGPFVELGVADVIRDEQLLLTLAVVVASAAALVVHRRSTHVASGRDESST